MLWKAYPSQHVAYKVEVAFSGAEGNGENIKSETENTSLKVLPPWMIKQGMNLTQEQRGEVKQEAKMDGSSAVVEFSDDKKSTIESDDQKNIQDEYVKAYYAALLKKQQELEEAAKKQEELSNPNISNGLSGMSSGRQVGMKSKRDEDEGDDDVDWEEAPVAGNSIEHYKVDLNVEADAEADAVAEDDDDVDWEEG